MSGSTTLYYISQAVPRANASGTTIVAYDPVADTFVTLTPGSLQGQQGPAGPTGPTGPQGAQGVPGSPGTNGTAVRNGVGAPAQSTGVNGDFYVDTQNWLIYGPKANGLWPTGVSIIGPAGPTGPTGPAGADGTGGGGTANLDNGTVDGQFATWSVASAKWVPVEGQPITADRTPTVEINSNTTLTALLHNRRNLVLLASASLTLAASEAGTAPNQGFEVMVNNDHTGVNTLTFGSGITVLKPASATGTAQEARIAINGLISVQVYPRNGALIAKVRGDVG